MGKKTKVVIDTNIFISAFGWGGKPLRIMQLLEKGRIINCISEDIFTELRIAITYPKLGFSKKIQTNILEFVLSYSDFYESTEKVNVSADPDDNKFIECALSSKAGYIITGDEDLLKIKNYKNIKFISPDQFLKSIG